MYSMRLLRQRALQQLFRSPPLLPRQAARHISSNTISHPPQCIQRQLRKRPSLPSSAHGKPSSCHSFPSSRFSQPSRRFRSTQTNTSSSSSSSSSSSTEPLTLSQRMRKLSREYGYAALGVYLALTALDLPFCYLAVSYLGTERIGHWEHVIMSYVKALVKWPMGEQVTEAVDEGAEYVKRKMPPREVQGTEPEKRLLDEEETYLLEDHGYKEAEEADQGDQAGFWTKMALAYAIHKSFIFVRVPITAAITPKVVKTLRSWGWNIGKMPTKKAVKGTGVNTAKSGVKPDK